MRKYFTKTRSSDVRERKVLSFLAAYIIAVFLLFSLHTNTACNLYYQYNLESFHTQE